MSELDEPAVVGVRSSEHPHLRHPHPAAYAHPLRARVLFEYRSGVASPSTVARRIGRRLNLVSYHTRVLLEHGLIELVRTERRRGATTHYYRATVASIIEDDSWVELPPQVRRKLLRELLTTIADASRDAAVRGGFDSDHAHLTRWPVLLDEADRRRVAAILRALLDDFDRIQAESDRRAVGGRRRFDIVLMGFRASA